MADQDPNAPPMAKKVGKASNAGAANPRDPQWWLAGSVHPYAPFVGNPLKWESNVYDDGTTFEGTMVLDVPHGKGTIVFGTGFGGGIQRTEIADKYEGEFDTGFAHGLGQYTAAKGGKVYRGEYNVGQRHGCGAEFDMSPFLKRLDAGADPAAAWEEVKEEVEKRARYGTWLRDTFFTGPDEGGRWCHIKEIRGTLQEVASVVARARMFQHKPDGEVAARFLQDSNGMPAPVMQDPLHYPHGTEFLAPGPLGQCHPVPGDEGLRGAMARAAANHQRIYDSYNLPYDPEPGSDMDKAQRLWKRRQARRQRSLDKKLQREAQKLRRLEGAGADGEGAAAAAAQGAKGKTPAEGRAGADDFDDDDLIASAEGVAAEQPRGGNGGGGWGGPPPSVLASVTLGLGRAAAALQRGVHDAAIRAPPRRALTRPQRRQ